MSLRPPGFQQYVHGGQNGLAEAASYVEVWPRRCLPAGGANDVAREVLRRLRRVRSQGAEVVKKASLDWSLGVRTEVVRHSGSSQS
jgi:hypothetical protein